tara:strand:- start:402 stop:572 length:171 start_codon:yes stop_codon:yes gene_type:complete
MAAISFPTAKVSAATKVVLEKNVSLPIVWLQPLAAPETSVLNLKVAWSALSTPVPA